MNRMDHEEGIPRGQLPVFLRGGDFFPGSPLSRRGFLKAGLLGSAGLAILSAVGWSCRSGYEGMILPGISPLVLTPIELAILKVCAETILPSEEGYLSVEDAHLMQRLDKELSFHETKLQRDVKASLRLIEYGGFLHLTFSRFTQMPPEKRTRYLERLAASPFVAWRSALQGLRFLCMFFYYVDARTWPKIHYAGPPLPRKLPEASSTA